MYGRALAEAGRLTEGVEQLTQAVDDAARMFGPTSRMVGFFSVPLVKFPVQSGRIDEALESKDPAKLDEAIARDGHPVSSGR